MSSPSFERANIVAGQSKITSEKIILGKKHKHFYNLHYIEIPDLVARKFELKDEDCLIWRYFHDKRAAIVTKREGWKSALEITPREFLKGGAASFTVRSLGVIVPFVVGFYVFLTFGLEAIESS